MLHRIVPPNNTNNLSSELDQLVDLAELELLSDTAKSLLKEEDNSNTSFQTQESIFIAIAGMNMGGFGSMPPMGGGQDGMPDFGATSGGMGGLPAMGEMGGFGGGMPPMGGGMGGGMPGHAFASRISTFFCSHSIRRIFPMLTLILPYTACRRNFGANTIWYLQFHRVCDKLSVLSFGILWPLGLLWALTGSLCLMYSKGLFCAT